MTTETAPYRVRMMPGQAPYAPEELAAVERLVAGAARAEELFDPDELERFAEARARTDEGRRDLLRGLHPDALVRCTGPGCPLCEVPE